MRVVILVEDECQIVVGFLNQTPMGSDHRDRAIPIATVQIETLRVSAFVVNEPPGVEAWKNPKI